MQTYRFSLFGQILVTNADFSHSLQSVSAEDSLNIPARSQSGFPQPVEINLIVKRQSKAPEAQEFQQVFPVGESRDSKPASLFIYKTDDRLRITYLDFAVYDINGNQITCYPAAHTSDKQLHLNFLGPVMSMWLEQNSYLVLHASAVLIGGKAVIFLADSLQGKSTLAAMMIKTGCPLLSDDLLAVKFNQAENQFYAFPSYPVIKLWPEHFNRVFENVDSAKYLDKDLKKCRLQVDHMNPDMFANKPCPLTMIYCLHRGNQKTNLSISPLSKIESLTRLIQYSFAAPIMIATGWQPERMKTFSTLVSKLPVRDLSYPSGIQKLDSVCQEIRSVTSSADDNERHSN